MFPRLHRSTFGACAAFIALLALTRPASASVTDTSDVSDLPLREFPAARGVGGDDILVVFLTGDGGWAEIDKEVVGALSAHGAATIGINSRAYLSKRKTPDDVARDVGRVIRHYADAWHRNKVVIAGYSRGADLAPFGVSRLPAELKQRVVLVAMLGLATRSAFEFHWQDIVRDVKRPGDLPTLPEVEALRGMRMLCVYGTEERDSGCRDAPSGLMRTVALPGDHHFDRKFQAIGDLIWSAISDQ
jgi:type IV secretory pathway VirJ component